MCYELVLHLRVSDDYEDILVDLLQTGNSCKVNLG
jgi:hypothetical protein